MAVDDVFEIATERAIQRYSRATLLEYSERLGEQTRPRQVSRQKPCNNSRVRFNQNLIPIRSPRHEPVEVIRCIYA